MTSLLYLKCWLIKFNFFSELQKPSSVHAVWTDSTKTFHMCWAYQDAELTPSYYRIMNSSYFEFYRMFHNPDKSEYNVDINVYRNVSPVFIQALSMKNLPSELSSVSISGIKLY